MSSTFDTRVGGIPCQCSVLRYAKEVPATYLQPADPEEFEFEILDSRGRRAKWLDKFINPDVEMRLLCEYVEMAADYFTEPDYD